MMQKKIHTYESDEITVTYDVKRCIHAGECVRGVPSVFNTQKKPWVQPDNAPAGAIADVIEKCPTGALHYQVKKGKRTEKAPSKNRIVLRPNGPVYLYGDLEFQDADGNTLLEDTRAAFCRCGASENKPLCDNSHQDISFRTGATADTSAMPVASEDNHDRIILKLMKNGPALVEGTYTLESPGMEPHTSSKNIALCRCGGSSNKPFCDGTHKKNGFISLWKLSLVRDHRFLYTDRYG
jgi:CDGSH-type Zn-finger protein/uncharacterized Fe-S cluster protein YjdI